MLWEPCVVLQVSIAGLRAIGRWQGVVMWPRFVRARARYLEAQFVAVAVADGR